MLCFFLLLLLLLIVIILIIIIILVDTGLVLALGNDIPYVTYIYQGVYV
jgi:hypothetical protein